MKIGILTIGNELMNGRIADTNSSFIAREINLQGWQIETMMSVGDDFTAIKSRLHYRCPTDAVSAPAVLARPRTILPQPPLPGPLICRCSQTRTFCSPSKTDLQDTIFNG